MSIGLARKCWSRLPDEHQISGRQLRSLDNPASVPGFFVMRSCLPSFLDLRIAIGVLTGTASRKVETGRESVATKTGGSNVIITQFDLQQRKQTISAMEVKPPTLTRELLAAGGATTLVCQDMPNVRLLSEEERCTSLAEFLRSRPAGDLWVFAYGSLVWNPAMRIVESRVSEVCGWHRSFCLSMEVGRGTPDEPGLALGLDRDGACKGIAYRIAENDIASELTVLWSREMLIGGYNPTWVDVIGDDGEKFGVAIAFTIDQGHQHYAGALPQHEKIRRLATARGSWGSSADYLFRTIGGLREHGIRDIEMERLGVRVSSMTLDELDRAA